MILWAGIALAGGLAADEHDARYLERTNRRDEAAAWFLANLDDVSIQGVPHLVSWLRLIGQMPGQRHDALVEQVRRWSDNAADGGVALALAHALSELGPDDMGMPFYKAGAWCVPAMAALDPVVAGPAHHEMLRTRIDVAKACGLPSRQDEHLLGVHVLAGHAGAAVRASWGAKDGVVDEADLAAVKEALSQGWWTLEHVSNYARDGLAGPCGEEARELVRAAALASASSDRPAEVWAAIGVLETEEKQAAQTRLRTLDPDNTRNTLVHAGPKPTNADAPVDATTLLDPAAQLAALQAQKPPARSAAWWDRMNYWSSRAEAAAAVGDVAEERLALAHQLKVQEQPLTAQRFAKAALAGDTKVRRAYRVLNRAITAQRDPNRYAVNTDGSAWRATLATLLTARAEVAAALGRTTQAADDLEEAMRLEGPTPERALALGLCYASWSGWERTAAPLLGMGLAGLPDSAPRAVEGHEALARMLEGLDGWRPDVPTYLAAFKARAQAGVDDSQKAVALDGTLFAALDLALPDGKKKLFDIEGPLVLDLWATWCAPCIQSLPHLDRLARTYEGRVTFIAASVDKEREVARQFLARRGEPLFLTAWLGEAGMAGTGTSGIPAMYVFDADHNLVAKLSGYGPGSTALDAAVEAMLAHP